MMTMISNFGGCVSNLLTELWTNSGPKFWWFEQLCEDWYCWGGN